MAAKPMTSPTPLRPAASRGRWGEKKKERSTDVDATRDELRQMAMQAIHARFSTHELGVTEELAEICPVEEVTASTAKARLLSLSSHWDVRDDPSSEMVNYDRWS